MFQKVPYVRSGDPISAETFNKLIDRANAPESTPPARLAANARPEFWIKNFGDATIPALSTVRIDGFASSFASASDARGAIASARIVLRASSYSGSTACAVALEGIPGGQVGRARSTTAPFFFAILTGSDAVSVGGRASYSSENNVVRFATDSDGDYVVVAFDSTSRLAALYFSPCVATTTTVPTYSLALVSGSPSSLSTTTTTNDDGETTATVWTLSPRVCIRAFSYADATGWTVDSSASQSVFNTNDFRYRSDDFFENASKIFCWRGVGSSAGRFRTLAANAPLSLAVAGEVATLSLDTSGLGGSGGGTTYTAGDNIEIDENNAINCTLDPPTYSSGTNIQIGADGSINFALTAGDGIAFVNGAITNTRSYTQGTNIAITNGRIDCTLDPPTYSSGTNIQIGADGSINCTLDPQTLTQGAGLSIDAADVISWNGVACDDGAFRTLEVESPLTLELDGTTATLGIDTTGFDGTVYTPGTNIAITNGRIDCTLTQTTYTPGTGISIEDGEISCTLTQTTYTPGTNIAITNGRIDCTLDPPTYSSGTNIQIGNDGSINCTLTPTFSLQAYSNASGSWGLAQSDGSDLYNASTSAFRYDSGDFATNSDGVFRWSGVRSTDGNGGAFRTLNATGAASLSFSGDVATLDVEEPPEYEVRATAPSTVAETTETDADDGTETKVFTLTAKIRLQAYAKNASTDVWALATSGGSNVYNQAIAAFKYDAEDFETNASNVFCWRGVDSDDGRFTKLEIDSTSPLSLDVANGVATLGLETSGLGGATYTAGGGINIDSDNEITATGGFTWAVWDGSQYVDGATLIANELRTMYFGRQFKRGALQGDTVGGTELEIDATSKTFMTGATLTPTLLGSVPTTFTLYKVTNGVASATSEYMIQPGGYVNVYSYALTPTTETALCLARTK